MKLSPLLTASLLYRQSYRVLNHVVANVLNKFEITPLEWAFLSAIYYSNEITVTELANLLGVETPMITQLANQDKIKTLILIKKSKDDKRVRTLSVNAKAKRMLAKLEKELDAVLNDFFSGVDQKDIDAHLRVLAHIASKD